MSASTDDPWADLYTELEVENAAKVAAPLPLPEADDDGEEDDGPDGEEAGAIVGEPSADGEQPKKRRRRRRRRKGKPGEGEAATAEGGEPAAEGDDQPADEGEAEPDTEPAADPSRDVIRSWNVPSWAEIVAGLHRPG